MSEDDKTDDQGNAGSSFLISPGPEGRPIPKALRDLRNQSWLSKGALQYPATITSVAETSAELFRPDQAEVIKAYMQNLKQSDKADVFALASGKVAPADVGIHTPLDSDVTQTYAQYELGELESKGSFRRDIWKYIIGAVIGLLIWWVKTRYFSG